MKAFTLMEMLIVLIIMGIITMMTMSFTSDQLSKLQRKTVKEAILTDYQSHYTKNLTSSRYAGQNYTGMRATLNSGSDTITFEYFTTTDNSLYHTETFKDKFIIASIISDPTANIPTKQKQITLRFSPYQGNCLIQRDTANAPLNQIALVFTIKEQKQYCFTISSQLCRMVEVPCEEKRTY
ncbi:MAG: type II secretion system GspH family protein [Candidatus Peribacteria bacterium]|nr:type II secretion system GspH family protein [Candidatus Peribacteria bacterium]